MYTPPSLTCAQPKGSVANAIQGQRRTCIRKGLSSASWTYDYCHTTSPCSPAPFLPIPSSMAAPVHVTHWQVPQVDARQYPHPNVHGKTPQCPTPWNAALVGPPRSNKRPSFEFKISSRGAKILNAVVLDSTARPLYSISSDESCTTLLTQKDSSKAATINWDHSSPRMVFRGKKVKCKEWLPYVGHDTKYVLLLVHASQL